jgi:hypothetical protein
MGHCKLLSSRTKIGNELLTRKPTLFAYDNSRFCAAWQGQGELVLTTFFSFTHVGSTHI